MYILKVLILYLLSYNSRTIPKNKSPRMTDNLKSCALLHSVFVCCLHDSMVITSAMVKVVAGVVTGVVAGKLTSTRLHGVFVSCLHGSMVVTSPTPGIHSVSTSWEQIVHDSPGYSGGIAITISASHLQHLKVGP